MTNKPIPHESNSQTVDDTPNRGYDTKLENNDAVPLSVSIQNVDEAIVEYLSNTIKPSITDNGAAKLVPVLYGTPERWSTFRKDGVIREPNSQKAQAPAIMIRRSSMERGQLSNPGNKYQEFNYEIGWNRRTAYERFDVLNGVVPSREFYAVMIPDYIICTYDVVLWTEYEAQMSDLIGQIQVEGDEYWGTRNGFKFKTKIDGFENQTDLETTQDRVVRTTFQMKVNAYLLPERMVKKFEIASTTKKYFSPKRIVIKEIFTDDPPDNTKLGPSKRQF